MKDFNDSIETSNYISTFCSWNKCFKTTNTNANNTMHYNTRNIFSQYRCMYFNGKL